MKLGLYEIEGELGRGGMGAVFRARTPDGRTVAVKVLLKPDSRASLSRFDRERRVLAELGEGFVPLLDSGDAQQGPFIVMPFMPGGTLRARIARGPIGVDEAVELGVALASAMGRAHERGVVHRDLKPENILFDERGAPLIADLGLAKHFAGGSDARSITLSKTGETRGTAGYMAPEQLSDAKSVGPAADVFALGAILYEALAGREAFGGDDVIARMAAVATGDFTPLRRARRDVPAWLARVIERALARKIESRFADGNELAAALAAGGGANGSGLPIALGILALVAIAVAAGVAALALRPKREARPSPTPTSSATAPPTPTPAPTPTPGATPAPAKTRPPFPDFTRAFRRTRTLKLAAALGDTPWKLPVNGGSVVFLRDGRRAAVSCGARILILDLETGGVIRTFPLGIGEAMSLDVSPDGDRLLVTGHQPFSAVYELASGRELCRLTGQWRQIYEGHFLGPGRVVTASDDDGTVRVWEVPSGKQVWSQRAHGCVFACAASSDGKLIATGGMTDQDETAWNIERPPHTGPPSHGDWSVKIWDAETGALVKTLAGARKLVHGLSFSPDGARVAASGWDSMVHVWDLASGELVRTLEQRDAIRRVRFASRSVLVTSGTSLEPSVHVWDLDRPAGGELVAMLEGHRNGGVGEVCVSSNGKRALSTGDDGTVRLWDLEAKKGLSVISGHAGPIVGAATTRDGRLAVTAGRDGCLRVWDLTESRETKVLDPSAGATTGLALDGDGARAFTSHAGGTVELWNIARGERRTLGRHSGPALAVAARAGRVISLGDDSKLIVWDLGGASAPRQLQEPPPASAISLSEDGDRALLFGRGVLTLWDLERSEHVHRYENTNVPAAALAPDASRAIISLNDAVALWDFASPGPVNMVEVGATALAVDGTFRLGAAAGTDGIVRIFDLASRREVDSFDVSGAGRAVTIAFCGDRLVVGTTSGSALVFEPPR